MYERIVVGTDGSATADIAVQTAGKMARAFGAALHVVTAYRSSGPGMGNAAGAPIVETGAERVTRAELARQVANKAVQAWGGGLHTEVHACSGDPADAIVEVASAVGADLIVVGGKGMRGARRVLGSVPNSVTHNAECAVLVVKTE